MWTTYNEFKQTWPAGIPGHSFHLQSQRWAIACAKREWKSLAEVTRNVSFPENSQILNRSWTKPPTISASTRMATWAHWWVAEVPVCSRISKASWLFCTGMSDRIKGGLGGLVGCCCCCCAYAQIVRVAHPWTRSPCCLDGFYSRSSNLIISSETSLSLLTPHLNKSSYVILAALFPTFWQVWRICSWVSSVPEQNLQTKFDFFCDWFSRVAWMLWSWLLYCIVFSLVYSCTPVLSRFSVFSFFPSCALLYHLCSASFSSSSSIMLFISSCSRRLRDFFTYYSHHFLDMEFFYCFVDILSPYALVCFDCIFDQRLFLHLVYSLGLDDFSLFIINLWRCFRFHWGGLLLLFLLVGIHDSHEIAILEFPTSDCSQNEAWCHAKRTDVTVPIENTWRRPNQHCKFNALVARIDDHSIVFNYAVWARCHHTVLNWPAILSERFVWCLKMTFNMRYRWKRGAHARAARRRVGCTQSHKIPHKINFCVNIAVSR